MTATQQARRLLTTTRTWSWPRPTLKASRGFRRFYVPDDRYDLYWTSWVEARHSANVRDHPPVAIVIFETDPEVEAVYISALAVELNDPEEVTAGIEIMRRRDDSQPEHWRIKDISVVTGDGPWRIYRASHNTIEVRLAREERGERIVTREDADFRSSL